MFLHPDEILALVLEIVLPSQLSRLGFAISPLAVQTVYGHFAPWSFRPQSVSPNQKSVRPIIEVISPQTKVTSPHTDTKYHFVRFLNMNSLTS